MLTTRGMANDARQCSLENGTPLTIDDIFLLTIRIERCRKLCSEENVQMQNSDTLEMFLS